MRESTIREAKNGLTALIRAAEKGQPVRLTRHGKPVAVLVSERDYRRLRGRSERRDPWAFLQRWRAQRGKDFKGISDQEVDSWRERRSEGGLEVLVERVKFVLDTHIFSELSKQEPDRQVLAKFQRHRFVSASCAPVHHELRFGISRIRSAKRRKELTEFLEGLLEEGIEVLPYDRAAADVHARARGALTARGVTPAYVDAQVAAIAMAHDAAVATRNVDDFRRFPGLRVDNWFEG